MRRGLGRGKGWMLREGDGTSQGKQAGSPMGASGDQHRGGGRGREEMKKSWGSRQDEEEGGP